MAISKWQLKQQGLKGLLGLFWKLLCLQIKKSKQYREISGHVWHNKIKPASYELQQMFLSEARNVPNSFYKASITLLPKPDKNMIQNKKQ